MKSKHKVIQYSDPGKILDLILNLQVEKSSDIELYINSYDNIYSEESSIEQNMDLDVLAEECQAELVFEIIIHTERNEGFIAVVGSTVLLRAKLLKITPKLEEIIKRNTEIPVLSSQLDPELEEIISPYYGEETKKRRHLTMFPIVDQPFSAIICVVSPTASDTVVSNIVQECILFTWTILKKTVMLEYERVMKGKCQTLLRVARNLFSQVASLELLLDLTMRLAKELTNAAYCGVLMIDVDRNELYDPCKKRENHEERRFPLNMGVVGEVIKTGKLINMQQGNFHPAFDPRIDSFPEVECKTLLCAPIREQAGIVGVLLLLNKRFDPFFDAMDEEMALSFSIYCGVCLIHSVVYQKIKEAHIRMALANELVVYHMKVSTSEIDNILECTNYHNHPHLVSLHFNHRALPLRELPCYVVKMFCEIGFDKRFRMKKTKLVSMVLQTKKGYRDVPYHNWIHAFNVAQWAYAALVNFKLLSTGHFTDLQGLMFLMAALMHDLDHRGTTNSFQIQGQTTLAALYSSEGSVMERHHLSQAMCILNTEGCDVLESLSRRDYDRALLLLRDFILATDLTNYFKNQTDYLIIAEDFQKGNKLHIRALSCLLMNCADLSDQIKDWGSVKKTAAGVLTEFFKQGDEEKKSGKLPSLMIDQDKCFIPDLQIQFLEFVCIPLYEIVSTILPKLQPCIKILENHIERWTASKPVFAEVPAKAGLSVLLSPELDNLIEINLREMELERERLAQEAEERARRAAEEEEEEDER